MMQSLRPYASNSQRATMSLLLAPNATVSASTVAGLNKQFRCLHQQARKQSTAQSSRINISASPALDQAFPIEARSSKRTLSNHHFHRINQAQGRASYSSKATMVEEPLIHNVFETKTGTWQYIIADPSTLAAVIIDPVLDYDAATGTVSTQAADSLLSMIKDKGYKIEMILETHAHADHITAATYLQKQLAQEQGHKPPIGIGKRIVQVQKLFSKRYIIPTEEYEGVFDKLFDDDEAFSIGSLTATAIHLPGHTPDHLGYKIGDNVFVGDSVFHADIGSARADFPGGSAQDLFNSCRKLLDMPDHVKIWVGHDYPPEGRSTPVPFMSVGDHRKENKHLKDGITEDEFVALRHERDATLAEPKLLHQSLQMNIRAGRLPKATEFGHRMLHLPLKPKTLEW